VGKQIDIDSKFCSSCGIKILSEKEYTDEKQKNDSTQKDEKKIEFRKNSFPVQRINTALLYTGIFISIFLALIIVSVGTNIILSFLSIIPKVIILIIYYQWIETINTMIKNSAEFFLPAGDHVLNKSSLISDALSSLKMSSIQLKFFDAYCVFSILSFILSISNALPVVSIITSIISLIIYAFMLIEIFNAESNLQYTNNRIYTSLSNKTNQIYSLTERKAGMVILFTIITLGIYNLYLLVKHYHEINEFISADEFNQNKLL